MLGSRNDVHRKTSPNNKALRCGELGIMASSNSSASSVSPDGTFNFQLHLEADNTNYLQELDPIVKLKKEAQVVQDEGHTQEHFAKMHQAEAEQRMRALVSYSGSTDLVQ
jgi:hypothetical protein